MTDSPTRWGILGTGGIAETFASDLALTDSGVVAAVGSRRQESADRFAEAFEIPNRHSELRVAGRRPGCRRRLRRDARIRCTAKTRSSRWRRASRCWSRSPSR